MSAKPPRRGGRSVKNAPLATVAHPSAEEPEREIVYEHPSAFEQRLVDKLALIHEEEDLEFNADAFFQARNAAADAWRPLPREYSHDEDPPVLLQRVHRKRELPTDEDDHAVERRKKKKKKQSKRKKEHTGICGRLFGCLDCACCCGMMGCCVMPCVNCCARSVPRLIFYALVLALTVFITGWLYHIETPKHMTTAGRMVARLARNVLPYVTAGGSGSASGAPSATPETVVEAAGAAVASNLSVPVTPAPVSAF